MKSLKCLELFRFCDKFTQPSVLFDVRRKVKSIRILCTSKQNHHPQMSTYLIDDLENWTDAQLTTYNPACMHAMMMWLNLVVFKWRGNLIDDWLIDTFIFNIIIVTTGNGVLPFDWGGTDTNWEKIKNVILHPRSQLLKYTEKCFTNY